MPKISTYTDGGAIQATDQFIVNRAGVNKTILGGNMQFPYQYKITPTGTGPLTVSLKHLDGTNPSTTKPLAFKIDDSWRSVIGSLSLTVGAGTNTFNAGSSELATKEIDLFAYVSWKSASSAVVFGISRIPDAKLYSDFSATATNEKYGVFTSAPGASESVVNIGRLAATLSTGAGYTWSTPSYTGKNLIQYPIFSTRKLTWASVLTGFSGTPTQTAQYQIVENRIVYYLSISGTSNATGFTATLPFTPVGGSNDMQRLVDNGVAVNGLIVYSGSSIVFYSSFSAGGWTNSGTKGCEGITKTIFI